jgi:hypothetical protein
MVLTLSEEEFTQMKIALLDQDGDEAIRLIKEFIKRLEQQQHGGMKSHLNA